MLLNDIWGYGQLFGYSAIDGPNKYKDDNILMTMRDKFEFRFEYFPHYAKIRIHCGDNAKIRCLMSDFFLADDEGRKIIFAFADNDTLLGKSPSLPSFDFEVKPEIKEINGVTIYHFDQHYIAFKSIKAADSCDYAVSHSLSEEDAIEAINRHFGKTDINALIENKLDYFSSLPECLDKKYEKLYYKSLSVNKVNVRSPEGNIDCKWTTPDRVPHRHMWMWDSAFHAMAISTYNHELAEEIFLAMLKQTKEDGFMPHMANPYGNSDITQPCVMSFGAYEIYKNTKNIDFLKRCAPYLEKYLNYDLNNRDKNKNGLLEWKTDPNDIRCKCGESGLDNSPRFDFDEDIDCVDFSSFFALDTKALSLIYKELGNEEKQYKWGRISNITSKKIDDLMWDDDDGVYYDRLFSGSLTKVLTPSSFLPMLAKIPNKEKAKRMVDILTDASLLYSPSPLSSISQKDPRFSNDMWRGGVWANINYFIIKSLRDYGYLDLAEELREKTLEMIDKWYQDDGCIFEFFDPKNEISPLYCDRKGKQPAIPDYRAHVHSISDYNWTACFAILLIQRRY